MPQGSGVPPQAVAPQADRSYTADELQAALAEERKVFQRRLVKEQQARREAEQLALDNRRHMQEMDQRFQHFQAQLESVAGSRGGKAPDDDSEVDWDSIETGKDIRRAIRAEVKALERERNSSGNGRSDEVAEELWAMRLEKMESGLKSKYQGISEEQIRQVLNAAYDSGVGDLDYVAHKLLGAPEQFTAGAKDDNDLDDLQDDARERHRASVLGGRAALAAANAGPKTVTLRRHQEGHADAERAALDWATNRGKGR